MTIWKPRSAWHGAGSVPYGRIRPSVASWCATGGWSAAAGPNRAGGPMPRPRLCAGPARRHGARPPMSSLEPCSHHGKTPPCADAMIAAGIARAVVALEDPDPRVSGRGNARMREAGIAVETGLLADAAHRLNAGFLLRIGEGRPLFTLKAANQPGRSDCHGKRPQPVDYRARGARVGPCLARRA